MAERRMFAKTIIMSDAFLDMPATARCLYFTLAMMADDDGFVNSPKSIMRQCGASQDDMSVLIAKRFVLAFDDGVIVIKHWRIHNYIRGDRYKETTYNEHKAELTLDDKKSYVLASGMTSGIPTVNQMETQVRLGKDRLGKDSKDGAGARIFIPPTVGQVEEYCKERGNGIDAQAFVDFYQSKNWMVGRNKMKDWQAAIRTWERRRKEEKPQAGKDWEDVWND